MESMIKALSPIVPFEKPTALQFCLERKVINGGARPHKRATGYAPARSIAPKKAFATSVPAAINVDTTMQVKNASSDRKLEAALDNLGRKASTKNTCRVRAVPKIVVAIAKIPVAAVAEEIKPPPESNESTGSIRKPIPS